MTSPCAHTQEERNKFAITACAICLGDQVLVLQQEIEDARKLGHELSHELRELREENERLKNRLAAQ